MDEKTLLDTIQQQALFISRALAKNPPGEPPVDEFEAELKEDALRERINEMQSLVDDLQKRLTQRDKLLVEADEKLRLKDHAIGASQHSLIRLQARYDADIAAKNREINNLKSQIEQDGKAISDLRAKLNRTSVRNSELTAELKALKSTGTGDHSEQV